MLDVGLLQRSVGLRALAALGAVRVKPDAPAAAEDAIVSLHQRIEGGPGLGAERRDGVRLGSHDASYPCWACAPDSCHRHRPASGTTRVGKDGRRLRLTAAPDGSSDTPLAGPSWWPGAAGSRLPCTRCELKPGIPSSARSPPRRTDTGSEVIAAHSASCSGRASSTPVPRSQPTARSCHDSISLRSANRAQAAIAD